MSNMHYYTFFSKTPQEARKEIQAGRLKGMTDINPMWRIKMLTEAFGVCGVGWKYVITNKRLESGCKGQISAFVDVDLFIKFDGTWSDAIQGTGGASFVADEKNGLYQSDECFKMALTDALGVACKALGMSADIYFAKDRTKHDTKKPIFDKTHSGWAATIKGLAAGSFTIDMIKEKYTLTDEVIAELKTQAGI